MKKISKVPGFAPAFKENEVDMLFDKVGLTKINQTPNSWEVNDAGNRLVKITDRAVQIVITSLCGHRVGEKVCWTTGVQVEITEIKLMRLSDITEEIAMRAGVEKVSETEWKHYSPEKFYPRSVLNKEKPGYPRYVTAVGSFHSLWCKKYEILEIYANPWIWQYTCKAYENLQN